MSEQIKSNQQLDDAINGAQTVSDLRERMLQTLAEQGQIVRTQDDEFNLRLVRQQQKPEGSLPVSSSYKFEKELTFDPESGRRNLMLRANSLEELKRLEAEILGY